MEPIVIDDGYYLDGDNDDIVGGGFVLTFRRSTEDIYPPEIDNTYQGTSANLLELHPIINITFNGEVRI